MKCLGWVSSCCCFFFNSILFFNLRFNKKTFLISLYVREETREHADRRFTCCNKQALAIHRTAAHIFRTIPKGALNIYPCHGFNDGKAKQEDWKIISLSNTLLPPPSSCSSRSNPRRRPPRWSCQRHKAVTIGAGWSSSNRESHRCVPYGVPPLHILPNKDFLKGGGELVLLLLLLTLLVHIPF